MPQMSNISWFNSMIFFFFFFVVLFFSLNYYNYLGFTNTMKFMKFKFFFLFCL